MPSAPSSPVLSLPVLVEPVDCDFCNAPCCKLVVDLLPEEMSKYQHIMYTHPGSTKAVPILAQRPNGYCVYHVEGQGCHIYDDKPQVCNDYSCASDLRITRAKKYTKRSR